MLTGNDFISVVYNNLFSACAESLFHLSCCICKCRMCGANLNKQWKEDCGSCLTLCHIKGGALLADAVLCAVHSEQLLSFNMLIAVAQWSICELLFAARKNFAVVHESLLTTSGSPSWVAI